MGIGRGLRRGNVYGANGQGGKKKGAGAPLD